jgi:hypothetical protein
VGDKSAAQGLGLRADREATVAGSMLGSLAGSGAKRRRTRGP